MTNTKTTMSRRRKCLDPKDHPRWDGVGEGLCPYCKVKVGRSFTEKLNDRVDAIPIEKRQQFMDCFTKGMNVGDAIKATDPQGEYDILHWSTVLVRQIKSTEYSYLESKVSP